MNDELDEAMRQRELDEEKRLARKKHLLFIESMSTKDLVKNICSSVESRECTNFFYSLNFQDMILELQKRNEEDRL